MQKGKSSLHTNVNDPQNPEVRDQPGWQSKPPMSIPKRKKENPDSGEKGLPRCPVKYLQFPTSLQDGLDCENSSGYWAIVKRCWLTIPRRFLKEGQTPMHMMFCSSISFLPSEWNIDVMTTTAAAILWQWGKEQDNHKILDTLTLLIQQTNTYLWTFLPFLKQMPVLVTSEFFGVPTTCSWS